MCVYLYIYTYEYVHIYIYIHTLYIHIYDVFSYVCVHAYILYTSHVRILVQTDFKDKSGLWRDTEDVDPLRGPI